MWKQKAALNGHNVAMFPRRYLEGCYFHNYQLMTGLKSIICSVRQGRITQLVKADTLAIEFGTRLLAKAGNEENQQR